MQKAKNKMGTTLITLGVIVALLAILLTPGFLDFSAFVDQAASGFVTESHFNSESPMSDAGYQAVETLTSFLKKASIAK